MPLYVRRRRDTGRLEIYGTVRPAGAQAGFRVRVRAATDSEALAREEAVAIEREIVRNYHLGQRPDVRSFADAYKSYLTHEPRSIRTIQGAQRLLSHFGTMRLDQISQEAVDKARAVIFTREVSPATVRRSLIVPLRAIMVHAAKRGWCSMPVFDAPGMRETAPRFLLPDQAEALIAAAAPHVKPLLRFLVCTGCRISEALALEWRSVDLAGARVTLWEGETKSGRRRVIDLVPAAVAALEGIGHRTGRVFLTDRKRPYRDSAEYGGQIKRAWATACQGAGLEGIGPHVLRHTWASWTYALDPDPMRLMVKGGWSQLGLVQRYAHLMPSGHEDAIRETWGLAGVKERRA